METDGDEWLTLKQATALLGLKDQSRLRQLLASGRLPGWKPGHDWMVKRSDLMAWANSPDRDRRLKTKS